MRKYGLALVVSAIFFLGGLFTLSDYGINWDGPFRMIRGQIYTDIFLPGEDFNSQFLSPILIKPGEYASRFDFLDGEEGEIVRLPQRPLFFKDQNRSSIYSDKSFKDYLISVGGHPPLVDNLAAISNRIFWQGLGLFGDAESYQLVYLLISAIGVLIVVLFTFEITHSYLASWVAGLSLFFYPLFFSEAHFNMKDPLQASMFAGSIWAFWHWVRGDRLGKLGVLGWFGVFGLFIALALATKWNIIFLPLILFPWLFLIRKTKEFKSWFKLGRLGKLGGLGIFGVLLFLVLTDPSSWSSPAKYFLELIRFYFDLGTRPEPFQPAGFLLPGGFNAYPLILFLTQSPEIILLLGMIGVIWVIRERGGELKIGYLLLLWLLVPIFRIGLPHIWFYNGLRQIMEVLPALAILTGIGTHYLISNVKFQMSNFKYIGNLKLNIGIYLNLFSILVIGYLLFVPVRQFHPNENAYFNSLVGGLSGAAKKGLVDKKITYGNIYRQAANWLNENAPKNSNIALLDGPMYALSPLFLRNDLSISPFHFSGFDQKGEYILTLYDPADEAVFAQKYPKRFLNPVRQILVDQFPMLTIYKNSKEFVKPEFKKAEQIETNIMVVPGVNADGRYLEVDLGKQVLVTRITLNNKLPSCPKTYTQFMDELIEFDSGIKYGLQERISLENGEIELSFPAEKTRLIKIYPLDNRSCFVTGQIIRIKYLSN